MKTLNIPEKIYLPKNGFEDFNDCGALIECLSIKDNENDIEYLRTDLLGVKEIDLEKEIKEEYLKRRCYIGKGNMLVILNEPQFNEVAKHFFELGMMVNNKAQKGE